MSSQAVDGQALSWSVIRQSACMLAEIMIRNRQNRDMKKIMITGAASAIAQATARLWAQEGAAFFLVDRDQARLQIVADDLAVRGAHNIATAALNLTDYARLPAMWQQALAVLGQVDIAFLAHGTLPKQAQCEQSWEATHRELSINFLSIVALLTLLAPYFIKRQAGTIAVISSVAGDRGRQSNYIYGSAKGGVSIFLQGLRNRLAPANVHVLTIKPGFVATPMTADFKKGLLWVQPEVVARGIVRAVARRREVVYLPWFWRWIMAVITIIPERFFKRLSL
jgi:decaprenylphospho-beta-D-erythro-pentofuranosid-2-ulose 2-reductase